MTISVHRNFSHIYIEESAKDYPLAKEIRGRFPQATQISIRNYQEVFHRSRQSWSSQKKSSKLILAKKHDGFLYPGSYLTPGFGHHHFYYNAMMLNCLYDCHYCYLQGMYPSANLVLFVNTEDYFQETEKILAEQHPMYLCVSYDNDLLAFEDIAPYSRQWIEFCSTRSDLLIELRTKSANYRSIADLPVTNQVIIAWTLSPEEVVKKYEAKTPSLGARVKALQSAIEDGWKVRICFDPVLRIENWKEIYGNFLESLTALNWEKIHDVSIGSFRMPRGYFRELKRKRPGSDLLYLPLEKSEQVVRYPDQQQQEIFDFMQDKISKFLPASQISFCE